MASHRPPRGTSRLRKLLGPLLLIWVTFTDGLHRNTTRASVAAPTPEIFANTANNGRSIELRLRATLDPPFALGWGFAAPTLYFWLLHIQGYKMLQDLICVMQLKEFQSAIHALPQSTRAVLMFSI